MTGKIYRIGEAAAKLNLKTYVLRFWEMEFSQIAPIRTEKGQRLYTEADLALLARIRYLLHERGLTIEGARRLLREEAARGMTYTGEDASLPGLVDEIPLHETEEDALPPVSGSGSALAEGALPGALAQASLFFPERKEEAASSSPELPHIIAELTAIRDLLTF